MQLLAVFILLYEYFLPITIMGWIFHFRVLLYLINRDEIPEFKRPWLIILFLIPVIGAFAEEESRHYIKAAANGLPLLCREDPCPKAAIQEGVNGYEYTVPEEFIDKINAVLSDADWRRNAGEHSEEIAVSFDKSNFAAAMEAVYESVQVCKECKYPYLEKIYGIGHPAHTGQVLRPGPGQEDERIPTHLL